MYIFSLYGVTGCVILDVRKIKKNLLYPVKYRFTYLRKQYYLRSGIDLSKEEWSVLGTTKKKDLIEKRTLIKDEFDRIIAQIKVMFSVGEPFSFELLKEYLDGGRSNDLFSVVKKKIKDLKKVEKEGSISSYNCAFNSLKEFLGKEELFLGDVTVDFLNRYEKWMLDNKRSYTTIGIYARQLRSIYNLARKNYPITGSQYPFGYKKYQIPIGESVKKALNFKQIKQIYDYHLEPGSLAEMHRDLWMFSYYCNGMNINDICRLTYANIINNEIVFSRGKVIKSATIKKRIKIPLLPEIVEIIDKWKNSDNISDEYIFPFLKEEMDAKEKRRIVKNLTRAINYRMTKIGKTLGIGKIGPNSARHTFATVLKRNGVGSLQIGDRLGHSTEKEVANYLDELDVEGRIEIASMLTKFKELKEDENPQ